LSKETLKWLGSFKDQGLLVRISTKLDELVDVLLTKAFEPPLVSMERSLGSLLRRRGYLTVVLSLFIQPFLILVRLGA
jgi:hypothetical protein